MESEFYTVFDLAQTGYRHWSDIIVAILLFGGCATAIKMYARDDKDARALKVVLWSIYAAAFFVVAVVQINSYRQFAKLKNNSAREFTTGHIVFLDQRIKNGVFVINGREFYYSSDKCPLCFGYQAEDFQLKPTFLVRATTADNVIVKLEVHKAHF